MNSLWPLLQPGSFHVWSQLLCLFILTVDTHKFCPFWLELICGIFYVMLIWLSSQKQGGVSCTGNNRLAVTSQVLLQMPKNTYWWWCFSGFNSPKKVTSSTPMNMNGWNLEITYIEKKNHLNQTSMTSGSMVIFQGGEPPDHCMEIQG